MTEIPKFIELIAKEHGWIMAISILHNIYDHEKEVIETKYHPFMIIPEDWRKNHESDENEPFFLW